MVNHEIILKDKRHNIIVSEIVIDRITDTMESKYPIIYGKIYRNKYKKKRNINKSESLYEYNGFIKEVDNDNL